MLLQARTPAVAFQARLFRSLADLALLDLATDLLADVARGIYACTHYRSSLPAVGETGGSHDTP